MYLHCKLKRSLSAPKCQFSPTGQILIQPFLEPFERNLGQKSYMKRLFQPTVGPISAKSALAIGLYWPCFKGVKLASKIAGTVLESPKTTLFLGLKHLFLIYSVDNSVVRSLVYMCSSLSHVCLDN